MSPSSSDRPMPGSHGFLPEIFPRDHPDPCNMPVPSLGGSGQWTVQTRGETLDSLAAMPAVLPDWYVNRIHGELTPVGTPAKAPAPEQAEGRRGAVDERTPLDC